MARPVPDADDTAPTFALGVTARPMDFKHFKFLLLVP